MSELTAYRERFPILAETTYLINHSLGAMPAEAERRLAEYASTWKTRGIRAWGEGWWTMPLSVALESSLSAATGAHRTSRSRSSSRARRSSSLIDL